MLKNYKLYGFKKEETIHYSLKSFLSIWWNNSDDLKPFIDFQILQGDLNAGAVTIVKNKGPRCLGFFKILIINKGFHQKYFQVQEGVHYLYIIHKVLMILED
jgi:hypothetical protein